MTDPMPLIHIGLHKTASTLLQDNVFANEQLGFCMLDNDRNMIHSAFVLRGALEYDPAPDALRQLRAEAKTAAERTRRLVISHERLSGYPASGGFDQGIIADRLHAAFPEAKVLILIREQRSMIYSMYLQTISDGGTLSLRRFLKPPEPGLLRKPGFRFDYYCYDRLVRKYHGLFGAENVLVLPFEALRRDPKETIRQIISHGDGTASIDPDALDRLSNTVNKGRPIAFQAIRRRVNMLLRNQLSESGLVTVPVNYVEQAVRKLAPATEALRPLDRVLKPRMQAIIAQACSEHFEESNRETERLTGLDLASFGYSVSLTDRTHAAVAKQEEAAS